MMTRWILLVTICLGLVGCGGSSVDLSSVDMGEVVAVAPPYQAAEQIEVMENPDDETNPLQQRLLAQGFSLPDKAVHMTLSDGGPQPIGEIFVVAYQDQAEAQTFYKEREKVQPFKVGEQGSVEFANMGGSNILDYLFLRCHAVVQAQFTFVDGAPQGVQQELDGYMKRLDEQITQVLCGD